jgi:programmed cell death 6-interacting protein
MVYDHFDAKFDASAFPSMSNLLSIPFKKAEYIEVKHAARAYISDHSGAHPEEFRDDINSWQDLRTDAISEVFHEIRIDGMLL